MRWQQSATTNSALLAAVGAAGARRADRAESKDYSYEYHDETIGVCKLPLAQMALRFSS